MEFTTGFELQSQTTRLFDICLKTPAVREYHPLCYPVPRDFARTIGDKVGRPQLSAQGTDSQPEHVPFQSPLLRKSWLVPFPPLNNMLKFGESIHLT